MSPPVLQFVTEKMPSQNEQIQKNKLPKKSLQKNQENSVSSNDENAELNEDKIQLQKNQKVEQKEVIPFEQYIENELRGNKKNNKVEIDKKTSKPKKKEKIDSKNLVDGIVIIPENKQKINIKFPSTDNVKSSNKKVISFNLKLTQLAEQAKKNENSNQKSLQKGLQKVVLKEPQKDLQKDSSLSINLISTEVLKSENQKNVSENVMKILTNKTKKEFRKTSLKNPILKETKEEQTNEKKSSSKNIIKNVKIQESVKLKTKLQSSNWSNITKQLKTSEEKTTTSKFNILLRNVSGNLGNSKNIKQNVIQQNSFQSTSSPQAIMNFIAGKIMNAESASISKLEFTFESSDLGKIQFTMNKGAGAISLNLGTASDVTAQKLVEMKADLEAMLKNMGYEKSFVDVNDSSKKQEKERAKKDSLEQVKLAGNQDEDIEKVEKWLGFFD